MDHHVSNSTIFLILNLFLFLHSSKPQLVSDYTSLVYKTCTTQTFNNNRNSQTLSSLFQQLTAHSSQSKFFKTREIIDDDTTLSGIFQCRDDLTNQDCFTCVNLLPDLSTTLCGDSTSARVQLQGCYIHYETEKENLPQTDHHIIESKKNSSNNLLYKDCGKHVVSSYDEELMEEAFVKLESEILNSNNGYYYFSVNYKSVKLMAQCEGDSDNCECSNCVSDAVEVAKEECGVSLSAQIYLDKCFLSYMYLPESYANPGNGAPGGSRNNNNTQKLAAIIVGGAAALFLGFIFLSLLNSQFKKDDCE